MIPVLSATTTLTGHGLGHLSDALTCKVTHEINGEYELRMTYPVTGLHYEDIAEDRIIWAAPDNVTADQAFRIYRITRPLNGIVTIYARHIAYDMSGIIIEPYTASSITTALTGISSHAVPSCPFSFTTSRSVASTFKVNAPATLWSLLGGTAGSLLDVYGGEWDFNNFTVTFASTLGMDRGVSIRYGKNLTQFEQDITVEGTYAAVYPFWYDEDTGTLVTLTEKYITITGAQGTRILLLDCADYFENQPTEAQLRTRANSYITANKVGDPEISWKVNFAMLAQAGEYETQALLEQVQLGDKLSVYYEPANLTGTARAVKTVYDALLERYDSVTLGRVKQNLAKIIANTGSEINKAVSVAKSSLERAIDNATSFITNGTGYIRFIYNASNDLQEIVSLDTPDISTATKVWRWNNGGFGYSSSGYGGPYGLAITQNGEIVADYITAGTMAGNRVRTGLIEDETGTNWWNLDTGELHIGNFGGRNLIKNTLEPSVDSASNYPTMVGGGNGVVSGIPSVAEHGIRVTAENAGDWIYIGLGGSTGMNGLTPGATYTISFDASFKLISSYTGAGSYSLSFWVYVDGSLHESFQIQQINAANAGQVFSGKRFEQTFTVPGGATACRLYIRQQSASSTYAAAGDYIEIANIKLEKGSIATAWTPAPEDYVAAITTGDENVVTVINQEYSSQFDVLSDSITQTVERLDTLSNGLQAQISTTVQNTADSLTVNIQQAQETADGVQEVLDEYFEFLATGLRIRGTKGSSTGSYLNLAADEVGLYVNSTKRLWLTADGANADYFNASEGVRIGTFIWEQYPGGIRLRKA